MLQETASVISWNWEKCSSLHGQASFTTIWSPSRSAKATWPPPSTDMNFFCEVIMRKLTQPRTSSSCRDVTVYKQANNIITEDMPTRSPDLYVIEHALDMLHKAVNARQPLGCEMNALLWDFLFNKTWSNQHKLHVITFSANEIYSSVRFILIGQ